MHTQARMHTHINTLMHTRTYFSHTRTHAHKGLTYTYKQAEPPPPYESVLADTSGFFSSAATPPNHNQFYNQQGEAHQSDPAAIHVQVSIETAVAAVACDLFHMYCFVTPSHIFVAIAVCNPCTSYMFPVLWCVPLCPLRASLPLVCLSAP
jgi:hypothetical protein